MRQTLQRLTCTNPTRSVSESIHGQVVQGSANATVNSSLLLRPPHFPDLSSGLLISCSLSSMERSRSRKRHRTDRPSPPEDSLTKGAKKRRTDGSPPHVDHPPEQPKPGQPAEADSHWQYPPEFWDRLSQIPLVHGAIEELDRRSCVRPSYPSPSTESVKDFTPAAAARELARFARHGGPDLCNLRGYPPPPSSVQPVDAMSSPPRSRATKSTNPTTLPVTSKTTTTKKSTTPYNRAFEQHLTDHAIHPTWRSRKPDLKDTKAALAVSRRSLSPSRFSISMFETFQGHNDRAKDENDVKAHVIPIIMGPTQHDHPMAMGTLFGNLEPLTDGTLAPANPDIYYGTYPEELDRSIRGELAKIIIPSTMQDKPLAPNLFLEIKGPNGSTAVAARQARYDGALGARAMHALQNYGKGELEFDGNAYAFSSTYHDGTLKIYTHHITAPSAPDLRPEYHMTQVNTWAMTGNIDDFCRGATAFRNARDLAKQHRDRFIQGANTRASQARTAAAKADIIATEATIATQADTALLKKGQISRHHAGNGSHYPCTGDDPQEPSPGASPRASREPGDDPSMSFNSSFTSGFSGSKRSRQSLSPPSRSSGSRGSKTRTRPSANRRTAQ
ncbi:hypothetical protein CCMA1212_007032 [Trichoderma ghanense]|uniref:DUF7924 domain-containing protein n=1 Tax=Trichoderma ghanense TaxID=65468 RepID=A0ABY2GYZ9_9HYPO